MKHSLNIYKKNNNHIPGNGSIGRPDIGRVLTILLCALVICALSVPAALPAFAAGTTGSAGHLTAASDSGTDLWLSDNETDGGTDQGTGTTVTGSGTTGTTAADTASNTVTGIAGGAFEVTRYAFKAVVRDDHSYDVVEKISVNIPDQLQSIDFAIPSGNFRISNIRVEDANYAAKKASEASVVSIVDPDKLSAGSHEYTIRYLIQEYEDGDEAKDMFYFNVLLPEWRQPIGRVIIKVEFPDDFPWSDMQCYAGQFGVQDSTNKISFDADEDTKTVTVVGSKIPENYGITLKAQLPEGYWKDPLDGSWAIMAILIAMDVVLLLLVVLWFIGGRDPKVKRKRVTGPPEDIKPVEIGYIFNSKVEINDVLRLVLYFAEKGYLSISEYEPKRYMLYRLEDPTGEEKLFRNAYNILFDNVFKGRALGMEELGERLWQVKRAIADDIASGFTTGAGSAFTPLSKTFRYIGAALLAIGLGLSNAFSYSSNYLQVNYAESAIIMVAAAAAVLLLCIRIDTRDSSSIASGRLAEIGSGVLVAIPALYTAVNVMRNSGNPMVALSVPVLYAVSVVFIVLMRARGKDNAELVTRIRSLRDFIYHPTPKELLENYLNYDNYYYEMLIYALAFGAEESWAISFLTLDVPEPEWYSDDIEGHAFTNLREKPTTIDYARDLRSFFRIAESAYNEARHRKQSAKNTSGV